MSISPGDQQLHQVLTGSEAATISDVIATMESIDQALPSSDGLKWFNLLYLMVTKQVNAPPAGEGSLLDRAPRCTLCTIVLQRYHELVAELRQRAQLVASALRGAL